MAHNKYSKHIYIIIIITKNFGMDQLHIQCLWKSFLLSINLSSLKNPQAVKLAHIHTLQLCYSPFWMGSHNDTCF